MKTDLSSVLRGSAVLLALAALLPATHAGTDVSRAASWAASWAATSGSFDGNSHGSTIDPTDPVWSYYQQAGRDESGASITTLLSPSSWTALTWSSANANFSIYEPNGGRNRGRVEINSSGLVTSWNVTSSTAAINAFKPSWAITTYTEFNPAGGIYDISGQLSWTLGNTSPTSGAIYVTIAKISGDTVTTLYSTATGASALGTYTLFDDSSLPSSLTGIVLQQGDRLAFAIRGADAQFRTITLNDQDLKLTLTGTAIPEPAHAALLSGAGALLLIGFCARRKRACSSR